eukprot:Tbor_TRINITY_DN4305_c0_g1::TRINITY_DN4305_c0_g1_i1::g.7705::m.7705/K16474/IFT88; intraflagellar transport protein 88
MTDLYDAFDLPTQESQWGGSNNPYNVAAVGRPGDSSLPCSRGGPPSSSGANPLMQRPPSKWGAVPGSRAGVGSQWGRNSAAGPRPMTSNAASGFRPDDKGVFDPTGQGKLMGTVQPLKRRGENSLEEQCMEMEREVNTLIEESATLSMQGDHGAALEKAKDAGKKERALCRQREQLGLEAQINVDLTYAVQFNLAVQYHRHQLYTEALNTYSLIVRNMQFPQSSRLRVNMGNIYAEQKKYLLAIKMYRTALDETPAAGKDFRLKIMRNIGNAFVKMGQYNDALGSYESVMEGNPDIMTGFNLLLCYYALGDVEKLKRTFHRLLGIRGIGTEEEDDDIDKSDKDVLVDDGLRKEIKERRRQYLRYVIMAARLIAPLIDPDWRIGYDWVIEQLRNHEVRDSSSKLASELEMCKALNYLKYKKYKEAIDSLKAFEKKDKVLRARAATNLAYLYYLEGDLDSGEKYADMSIEFDQYNAKALVNKGNFLYSKGELDRARGLYNDALMVEADNVEAIYNLGLTTKALGLYDESLRMFKRLQSFLDSVEVTYQIADLNFLIGDSTTIEWFTRVIGRVPTDPGVLARLGHLYAKERDESQAFHHYLEAYRYYQVNMDVISWLGAYFVHNEVYDKALQFFERASQLEPTEVKWQLMTASCHRRRGEYPQAKRLYEEVHRKNPENLECLRFLVTICKDSGFIEEANKWLKEFKKVESRLSEKSGQDGTLPVQHVSGAADEEDEKEESLRHRGDGEGKTENKNIKKKSTAESDDDEVILPGV